MNWLERTELLVGNSAIQKLSTSNVLVVGLGGVGSYAAEFLVRAGVQKLTIIDGDVFDPTNKNRQLTALDSTIGLPKAKVLKNRFLDINKDIELTIFEEFLLPERMDEIVRTSNFDFACDCIDSFQPKVNFMLSCKRHKVKLISSMGAGGIVDPSKVLITNLKKTENNKLATKIKKNLKRRGLNTDFKVVSSNEAVNPKSKQLTDGTNYKRSFYGTISYMPALFGLQMSSYVIRKLIKNC